MAMYSKILGTGSYLPAQVRTNADLEKMVDTSDEWIVTRTGIHERRIANEDESVSVMGLHAAKNALEMAQIEAAEIGLIIVATTSATHAFPSAACQIQQLLGINDCAAFDVAAACAGFTYAISIADQFVKTGMTKKALVIGADALSKTLDPEDRGTIILFGDAAGAVVIGASEEPGIISTHLHADGRYGDYYEVKYKGDFIEIDGNDYLVKGKKMSDADLKAYQKFMSQFLIVKPNKAFVVANYGKDFILYYNSQPLGLINGTLATPDGKEIQNVDQVRLRDLAIHVRDGRGDFFVKGKPGKDFQIYFKGKELQYNNRELTMNGRKLDNYLHIKSMESADTATSYLWLITILHLAHIVFTLLYMVKLTIASFAGKYNSEDSLSLRLGAIFWHFLGLLWLYLLLFLLFIH